MRIVRPNLDVSQKAPSSAATSTGPPPHSEEVESEGGWVLDALKKVLNERQNPLENSSPHHSNASGKDEVQKIRHEMRRLEV